MTAKKRKWRVAHVSALSVLLAACSKGPSTSEAKAAVQQQLQAFMSLASGGNGGAQNLAMKRALDSFILGECREASGRPGYVCAYTLTVNGAPVSDEGRFVQSGGGWQMFKN